MKKTSFTLVKKVFIIIWFASNLLNIPISPAELVPEVEE